MSLGAVISFFAAPAFSAEPEARVLERGGDGTVWSVVVENFTGPEVGVRVKRPEPQGRLLSSTARGVSKKEGGEREEKGRPEPMIMTQYLNFLSVMQCAGSLLCPDCHWNWMKEWGKVTRSITNKGLLAGGEVKRRVSPLSTAASGRRGAAVLFDGFAPRTTPERLMGIQE